MSWGIPQVRATILTLASYTSDCYGTCTRQISYSDLSQTRCTSGRDIDKIRYLWIFSNPGCRATLSNGVDSDLFTNLDKRQVKPGGREEARRTSDNKKLDDRHEKPGDDKKPTRWRQVRQGQPWRQVTSRQPGRQVTPGTTRSPIRQVTPGTTRSSGVQDGKLRQGQPERRKADKSDDHGWRRMTAKIRLIPHLRS